MPTYDYRCDKCGHTFEETLKIVEKDAPTELPCIVEECGGEVKQVMAAPYFGYDNIKTRHSTNNKEPGWFSDKIKSLKTSKRFPGNTL